jgi:hypothetical protein
VNTLKELTEEFKEELGNSLTPSEEPLDTEGEDEEALPGRGKPSAKFTQGRVAFDRKGFSEYRAQPIDNKREYLKTQWLDLTYLLLLKASTMAQTVQKKDFGRLVQILTSAGIAHDKVFPKVNDPSVSNLVVNMFKGLPSDRVLKVIGGIPSPQIPLEGNALEGKPLE